MEPQGILEELFDSKVLAILKFFLKNDHGQFYLREISRLTNVSAASTYRILNQLVDLNILKYEEIKTAKLYSLNQNKNVEFLKSILEVDVVEYFVDNVSKLPNVEEVILLGSKTKTKANLLLLGENIDSAQVKLLTGEIKEKHDFTINQMTLQRAQFEQMSDMGLYPGSKKVLYKRV